MGSPHPITIIGGGLAGLTLGIGLRRRNIPVTVCEAGRYPRHRVCGEFISGNGQSVLERLKLRESFQKAGAFQACTAQFIAGPHRSPVRPMPSSALCLSRYTMDAMLAAEFQELGGELQENTRSTPRETEGLVHASGRSAQSTEHGYRWFGMKVHVRNVNLAADLEMHISKNSYVGVNRIDHNEVNLCGLFRTGRDSSPAHSRRELLRGEPGSTLFERLRGAEFDEASFCAVGGLSLKPQRAASHEECRIGDAITMIPPVTGNGMSMAFESAEIAIEPLTAYSRGELNWTHARQRIAAACDAAFGRRLAWARFLQWMMFSPLLQTRLAALVLNSEYLWQTLFARTR